MHYPLQRRNLRKHPAMLIFLLRTCTRRGRPLELSFYRPCYACQRVTTSESSGAWSPPPTPTPMGLADVACDVMAASPSGDSRSFDELQLQRTSLDTLLQKVCERQKKLIWCDFCPHCEPGAPDMQAPRSAGRKRFLTSCSTSPKTKKKQKVQDALS